MALWGAFCVCSVGSSFFSLWFPIIRLVVHVLKSLLYSDESIGDSILVLVHRT